MTPEVFRQLEEDIRRGKRQLFVLLALAALIGLAMLAVSCSPALLKIEAPRMDLRTAPAYVPPRGKATVETPPPFPVTAPQITDAQLQRWLDSVTGRNTPAP